MTEAAMHADPLRTYIRTLREGRGLSQPELARRIGMAASTYIAWERGSTRSIKSHFLDKLIDQVQGAREHLDILNGMTPGEARDFALDWMRLNPEDQNRAKENAKKLLRVIELYDEDPQEMYEIIQEVIREGRGDPAFLIWLNGVLAGRGGARRQRE